MADGLNGIAAAGPVELKAILAHYPEVIRLNVARSAIQAYDCGGSIVAHLPLTKAAMRTILD